MYFLCAICQLVVNQSQINLLMSLKVTLEGNQIETDVDADAGDNVDDKDPQGRRRERAPELFEDDLVEGEVAGEQVQDQDGGGEIKQILNNQ